ncbi:hypothetical protein [Marinimicrobium alkaliphilum]|uniref:hypothetical protein n=1 Tax=Marinimicrobium alkaliphilum TaxID=2202654 RepID=UPI001300A3DC|nr:hypothetical protein [Marinimicrobium alkaliphilum]
MANSRKSNADEEKSLAGFIVVALLLVLLSVLATLHLSGVSITAFGGQVVDRVMHRHVELTLGDAQSLCEQRARETFARRLRSLEVDTFSSRLDADDNLFKVFMAADLYANPETRGRTITYQVNCYTRVNRAEVTQFQYAAGGDMFGPDLDGRGFFGL